MRSDELEAKGRFLITSLDIRNFRCFRHLKIENCSRLNVVVGDNGAGKTALLEAIFLALGSSTEVATRLRMQRGLEGAFAGTHERVEKALWGGFFHNGDMSNPISLTLQGTGPEARSLEIARRGTTSVEFNQVDQSVDAIKSAIDFTWRDHQGHIRTVSPQLSDKGLVLPSTGEEVPNFLYFAANQTTSAAENADRFSELSQMNKHRRFVDAFIREYDWISDINVEVYARQPLLFATLADTGFKLPLPNVSSGLNRIVALMLGMASSEAGVVVVDEIENGIHHSHMADTWRSLLSFADSYNCQLFVSTHSAECLEALVASTTERPSDITLWQVDRGKPESRVTAFSGADLGLALKYGEEVR